MRQAPDLTRRCVLPTSLCLRLATATFNEGRLGSNLFFVVPDVQQEIEHVANPSEHFARNACCTIGTR
jgi:hypothetical protein